VAQHHLADPELGAAAGVPGRLGARDDVEGDAQRCRDVTDRPDRIRPVLVDLFPAVPTTVAIELGRGLMRGAQPAVRIYDRQRPGEPFAYALEINR
jgi:hypothetical protein